jgi:DNA-binding transcriptional MerR regulator
MLSSIDSDTFYCHYLHVSNRASIDLNDLCQRAGLTVRTVRYYIQQGLLPAPAGRGPGAHYDRGHLERLELIKRLRAEDLPLARIREILADLDDSGVREALNASSAPAPSSALEYVRALLGPPEADEASPHGAWGPRGPAASRGPLQTEGPQSGGPQAAALPERSWARARRESASRVEPPGPQEQGLWRSQWERVTLAPDVELHIRRPLSRTQNRAVEELLRTARTLFAKEER